jgi:hypothetical protein
VTASTTTPLTDFAHATSAVASIAGACSRHSRSNSLTSGHFTSLTSIVSAIVPVTM